MTLCYAHDPTRHVPSEAFRGFVVVNEEHPFDPGKLFCNPGDLSKDELNALNSHRCTEKGVSRPVDLTLLIKPPCRVKFADLIGEAEFCAELPISTYN